MKKLLLLLLTASAFGQGARFGDGQPVWRAVVVPGVSSTLIGLVPSAGISFCASPANAVPCTNKATTYTDQTLTSPCATSIQVVLATTTTCVGTTDAYGNWGVWAPPGEYEYTITVSGASSGPYHVTLSPPSSGTGTIQAGSFNATGAIPFTINGVAASCSWLTDCSTLVTITGALSPINKNFMTAANNNSIQLLASGGIIAESDGSGAPKALYSVVIPQNTPGPGKCIHAEVAFIHSTTTGAAITYQWSFVAHGAGLANSGTNITTNAVTAANNSIDICNAAGIQTGQTLNQHMSNFAGVGIGGGVTTTTVDLSAAGGADLAFTFNVASGDKVTPKFFMVTELL